jgi:hypothetical protein
MVTALGLRQNEARYLQQGAGRSSRALRMGSPDVWGVSSPSQESPNEAWSHHHRRSLRRPRDLDLIHGAAK